MRPRKFPTRRILILALVAVTALGVVVAASYWPHLHWRFGGGWQMSRDVRRVAVTAMTAEPSALPSASYRFGPMSFSIPESMSGEMMAKDGQVTDIKFSDRDRMVAFFLPCDNRETAEHYRQEFDDGAASFSIVRQQLKWYEADAADFHWGMTHAELQRHRQAMAFRWLPSFFVKDTIEARLDDEIEGQLLVGNRGAVFEWQADRGAVAGAVVFDQRKGQTDLNWIRSICLSLRCERCRFPIDSTVLRLERLPVEN